MMVRGNLGTVTAMISRREDILAKFDQWYETLGPSNLQELRNDYDFESDFYVPASIQLSIELDEGGRLLIAVDEWNSPRFSFEDDLLNNWLQTLSGEPEEIISELCGEIESRNSEWPYRAVWSYEIPKHLISDVLREFQVTGTGELTDILIDLIGDGSESNLNSQRAHQTLFKLGIVPQLFDTAWDVLRESIQESQDQEIESVLDHLYGIDFVKAHGVQEPAELETGYY
jgi:hypothetical protein